mmetsp:Transcript_24637/g.39025  ORF Transcript_24637/g.39025 Transcript_24637/m.39025 type:complete len:377 (-) Transcript_24637:7-1137(-)|eukprot:CAMPEP_0174379524 /NCGR_PEP_ID=MMETSP0811_2-20130205/122769_1 /TAXON_ID=73025 ORGANISM="Eutreptiella gymnastica-like, Strain CCMP1594" /NCGR_SAMPLE_ID=MMETSP0811_2 /ASSEMBLY_ACC=CAM_ASM_000667 /LENGTH=376 /DNA_ID=CAMNT_0015532095 /DNA_START=1008 /DNA_END=2138 /DNA_ORIENTATION=+
MQPSFLTLLDQVRPFLCGEPLGVPKDLPIDYTLNPYVGLPDLSTAPAMQSHGVGSDPQPSAPPAPGSAPPQVPVPPPPHSFGPQNAALGESSAQTTSASNDAKQICAKCNAPRGNPGWWPNIVPGRCPAGGTHLWLRDKPKSHPGHIRYKVMGNYSAGVATGHTIQDPWKVYQVDVLGVQEVFGSQRQEWNRNYGAAQRIFGDEMVSLGIRAAIHVAYSQLYIESMSRNVQKGYLQSGTDFLQLIEYGLVHRKPRMFTYVMLDDCIRFSETGAVLLKDQLSKHALHANAAREVRFAGEFHVHPVAAGHCFVIDNNSGTYAPDKALLPQVAEVLLRNFPSLNVEAYDREDPRLKAYTEHLMCSTINGNTGAGATDLS